MKLKKRLKKVIDIFVKESFFEGELMEKKAKSFVKALSSLPSSAAISAVSAYLAGVKREIEKTTLTVESAEDLSEKQKKEIRDMLSSKFKILNFEYKIDSSLLGGARIKIGDVVFDDSVSRKIESVRESIVRA